MNNYAPLKEFFNNCPENRIELTFNNIEKIIPYKLPVSAHKYSAWWSGNGHPHCDSWISAGFKVKADRTNKTATFYRDSSSETFNPSAKRVSKIETVPKINATCESDNDTTSNNVQKNENKLTINGYTFDKTDFEVEKSDIKIRFLSTINTLY